MPLVIINRVARIARATSVVPPVTGYHDVIFVWDAVSGADTYSLELSNDLIVWSPIYSGPALTETQSMTSGTWYSRVRAYQGVTLLSTTDPQEFTV